MYVFQKCSLAICRSLCFCWDLNPQVLRIGFTIQPPNQSARDALVISVSLTHVIVIFNIVLQHKTSAACENRTHDPWFTRPVL